MQGRCKNGACGVKPGASNAWTVLRDLRTAWQMESRAGLFRFLGKLAEVAAGMKFADFVAACEQHLDWTHSVTCRWLRIARWVGSVHNVHQSILDRLPVEVGHLDELQRVEPAKLLAFAKMFPLVFSDNGVSRPELSRLIDEFLGLSRQRRQLDFFDRLRFPDLEAIRTASLEEDLHIDPVKAGEYGVTMLSLAIHKVDAMEAASRSELISALSTLLSEVCGNDPAKVLEAIQQAS